MRGRVVLAALAGGLAACSLGALDGFSGGGAESVPEGGVATDSSTIDDAAPGTDVGVDAAKPRFCSIVATSAAVCADFDDGTAPLALVKTIVGNASLTIDDGGKDGTRGALFAMGANANQGDGACYRLTVPSGRTSISIDLDLRIDEVGVGGDFDIIVVGGPAFEVGVHAAALGVLEFEEDDGTNQYTTTSLRLDATYRHVRFVVSSGSPEASATLTVDDKPASINTDPRALSDVSYIEIGDCDVQTSKGWTVRADNIVVDLP